jgi:hypothetical protein
MAGITNNLIYDVLKSLRSDMGEVKGDVRAIKGELQAIRGHVSAIALDVSTLYQVAGRHDERLERIETRLGLLDPAH